LLCEHSYRKLRNNRESGIAVGDIVIVRNEKSNRNFWKLAKVEELQLEMMEWFAQGRSEYVEKIQAIPNYCIVQ
jgi:hypothetical protein